MSEKIGRFAGPYEFLNNFYPSKLLLDGVTYYNAEAAYQAQKCALPADREQFAALGAAEAKKLGRSIPLRADWEAVKLGAMRAVLYAKFTQRPDLANALLETGDRLLQEGNYWHDLYWGVDLHSGEGENHLGDLLMELRAQLREHGLPAALAPEKRTFGPIFGMSAEDGDITESDCACIVNAANHTLLGGSGVDGAIHRAAGPELLEECRKLGGCRTGEAKFTRGGRLKARYVIHTVGPVYGTENAAELLRACYGNCLDLAWKNGIDSIAFPMLSTGKFGYPKREAAEIAVDAVKEWLDAHRERPVQVVFCCVDDELYREVCSNLHRLEVLHENDNLVWRKQILKFYPEDQKKMDAMSVEERIEFRRRLKRANRYIILEEE